MNGSENGYACALLFALASLGALVRLDGVEGWICGGVFALIAAISLRQAAFKSAQDIEENHQRLEIQFRQLHSKLGEIASINLASMNAITDAVQQSAQESMSAGSAQLSPVQRIANLRVLVGEFEKLRATMETPLYAKDLEKINSSVETLAAQLETLIALSKR